jgi:hypothetical protein
MANTIWKHRLELAEFNALNLTMNAKILYIGLQNANLCLWEAHDASETRTERRIIRMVGTGHEEDFPLDGYIGTVLTHSDVFVWHFFEMVPSVYDRAVHTAEELSLE